MSFLLTVGLVAVVAVVLVGVAGYLIDGTAEPRDQNERPR